MNALAIEAPTSFIEHQKHASFRLAQYRKFPTIFNFDLPQSSLESDEENSWETNFLQVYRANRGTILKEIKNFSFDFLRTLNFIDAKIQSIEAFSYFRSPNLQIICLQGNLITDTRSIKKVNSSKIKSFNITKNIVKEMSGLQEVNWPALEKISIENMSFDAVQNEGIHQICKLNTFSSKMSMSLESKNRIVNRACLRGYRKKFIQKSYIFLSTGIFQ